MVKSDAEAGRIKDRNEEMTSQTSRGDGHETLTAAVPGKVGKGGKKEKRKGKKERKKGERGKGA